MIIVFVWRTELLLVGRLAPRKHIERNSALIRGSVARFDRFDRLTEW